MQLPVYLDYSATTPTDPRVVEKMLPYLLTKFGNDLTSQYNVSFDSRVTKIKITVF